MGSSALHFSSMAAGPAQRRVALGIAFACGCFFVALAPFARTPLAPLMPFYVMHQTAVIVCDGLTAVLLFGQYAVTRSRALGMLCAGYVFGATMAVAHALSFPGLFAPGGLFAAPQTTAWLYFIWHAGFPLYIVAYARGHARETRVTHAPLLWGIVPAVAWVVLAVAAEQALPPLMAGDVDRPLKFAVAALTWSLAIAPLVMLWRRRPHSVLDVWLMVVLCAWCADSGLAAVFNHARFDLGWYAGRIAGLLASGFVLAALLVESVMVHERLAQAHRELEGAHSDLDRFVGGVAHDLQQPVLSIAGYAQVVQKQAGGALGDGAAAGLKRIVAAAQTADRMIQGLLQFARLGKHALEGEDVDLGRIIQEALTVLAADIERHRVQVRVAPLPIVRGDPVLLALAVVNVLSNAIKYSRGRDAPVVEVDAQPRPGGGHVLRVRDNGVGFDMAHAARLFTPFERLHGAGEFEGTGMGLANVRRIMERHGGSVRAEAAPGAGATFYLEFPA